MLEEEVFLCAKGKKVFYTITTFLIKGGNDMERMFRVLGFWTGIFAIMFFVGEMKEMALLFLGQTVFFVMVSYLALTERMYIYIFGAYLIIFFVGFTYYTTFLFVPGLEH